MHPAFIGMAARLAVVLLLVQTAAAPGRCESMSSASSTQIIQLPGPRTAGDMSVEAALQKRRSVRSYKTDPLDLAEISQLVWSAQGITHPRGFRTAPSAGALFPLELKGAGGFVVQRRLRAHHRQVRSTRNPLCSHGGRTCGAERLSASAGLRTSDSGDRCLPGQRGKRNSPSAWQ